MSIIDSTKEWLESECSLLEDFREMFVDYLGDDNTCYSLETDPGTPIVKRYVTGDTVKRWTFSFCSREIYGGLENLDTSGFYQDFSEWLRKCTREKNLPTIDGGEVRSISATTDGYLYNVEAKTCQYRIQCELIYFVKGA